MTGLSDFKRVQIVGTCMESACVIKTSELFGVARIAVTKVMTAFENEGKNSLLMKNSGKKLSDRKRRTLT